MNNFYINRVQDIRAEANIDPLQELKKQMQISELKFQNQFIQI